MWEYEWNENENGMINIIMNGMRMVCDWNMMAAQLEGTWWHPIALAVAYASVQWGALNT